MKQLYAQVPTLKIRSLQELDSRAVPQSAPPTIDGERPTQEEYMAWRLYMLHSPEAEGDRSGEVLPTRGQLQRLFQGVRRH